MPDCAPLDRKISWIDRWVIDPRSASAFRITLGVLLFTHAISHLRLYTDLYSPTGALPSRLLPHSHEIPYFPSILTWLETESWGFSLVAVTTTMAYFALTVGWKTRLATIVSLCAFSTICHRNPYLVIGGDELIGSMLLWCCLLPLGSRCSVDAWANKKRVRDNKHGLATSRLASFGALFQISVLYFTTAWLKSGPTWWAEATALDRITGIKTYRLPGAVLLESLPEGWLSWMTRGVLILEYAIPMMIMSPFAISLCRRLAIASMVTIHTGIALTTDTGLFSLTMLALVPLLLSSNDWEFLASFSRRFRSVRDMESIEQIDHTIQKPICWPLEIVAAFLLFGLLQVNWNVSYAPASMRISDTLFTLPWRFAAAAQRWCMFAPDPPLYDYHIQVLIYFDDGSSIVAWHNDQNRREEDVTARSRLDFLWKLYMQRTTLLLNDDRQKEGADLREAVCEFFLRSIQERPPQDLPRNAEGDPAAVESAAIWVTLVPTDAHRINDLPYETACVARHRPSTVPSQ